MISSLEEMADMYRSCDVGLVYMFTPQTNYQILEYMASGCATVTNINESNQWLVKDHENAILTEPTVSCTSYSIIELLEDDDLMEKISMNGLSTIKLNNLETEMNSLIDFIKNPKETK